MLSSRAAAAPSVPTMDGTSAPSCTVAPLAGGNGPLNVPLAGSIVGSDPPCDRSWSRAKMPSSVATAVVSLDTAGVGVTALVTRADSRLEGPDTSEFTSNAVTV